MLIFKAQNGSLLLSYDSLGQISTTLKEGKTIIGRVMGLILTMLGCIILRVDHRSHLREFEDILSARRLRMLRSDLENLRDFNSSFFNYLIAELIVEALRKEDSYRLVHNKKKMITDDQAFEKRGTRLVFRKKVQSIVRFLIFQKLDCLSSFNDNGEALRPVSYKEKIEFIFHNRINNITTVLNKGQSPSPKGASNLEENNDRRNLVDNYANCSEKNVKTQSDSNGIKLSGLKKESSNDIEYVCVGHVCKKIYCPICYGWLWIPFYYCCLLLYPVAINIGRNLLEEFII